jgi:ATP-dependent DNA helicase DinG
VSKTPSVKQVLAAAVEALGGQERSGQIQMAEAVGRALASGEHLLVQAGTGTGKSLGYLVPSMLHARRVVVATATLALQHQLVERDIPALLVAS